MPLTESEYQDETTDHTPMAVYMIRRLSPPAAVGAWLIIILALIGVPDFIIEALLMGVSVPVSVIIASFLILWIDFL